MPASRSPSRGSSVSRSLRSTADEEDLLGLDGEHAVERTPSRTSRSREHRVDAADADAGGDSDASGSDLDSPMFELESGELACATPRPAGTRSRAGSNASRESTPSWAARRHANGKDGEEAELDLMEDGAEAKVLMSHLRSLSVGSTASLLSHVSASRVSASPDMGPATAGAGTASTTSSTSSTSVSRSSIRVKRVAPESAGPSMDLSSMKDSPLAGGGASSSPFAHAGPLSFSPSFRASPASVAGGRLKASPKPPLVLPGAVVTPPNVRPLSGGLPRSLSEESPRLPTTSPRTLLAMKRSSSATQCPSSASSVSPSPALRSASPKAPTSTPSPKARSLSLIPHTGTPDVTGVILDSINKRAAGASPTARSPVVGSAGGGPSSTLPFSVSQLAGVGVGSGHTMPMPSLSKPSSSIVISRADFGDKLGLMNVDSSPKPSSRPDQSEAEAVFESIMSRMSAASGDEPSGNEPSGSETAAPASQSPGSRPGSVDERRVIVHPSPPAKGIDPREPCPSGGWAAAAAGATPQSDPATVAAHKALAALTSTVGQIKERASSAGLPQPGGDPATADERVSLDALDPLMDPASPEASRTAETSAKHAAGALVALSTSRGAASLSKESAVSGSVPHLFTFSSDASTASSASADSAENQEEQAGESAVMTEPAFMTPASLPHSSGGVVQNASKSSESVLLQARLPGDPMGAFIRRCRDPPALEVAVAAAAAPPAPAASESGVAAAAAATASKVDRADLSRSRACARQAASRIASSERAVANRALLDRLESLIEAQKCFRSNYS